MCMSKPECACVCVHVSLCRYLCGCVAACVSCVSRPHTYLPLLRILHVHFYADRFHPLREIFRGLGEALHLIQIRDGHFLNLSCIRLCALACGGWPHGRGETSWRTAFNCGSRTDLSDDISCHKGRHSIGVRS